MLTALLLAASMQSGALPPVDEPALGAAVLSMPTASEASVYNDGPADVVVEWSDGAVRHAVSVVAGGRGVLRLPLGLAQVQVSHAGGASRGMMHLVDGGASMLVVAGDGSVSWDSVSDH